MNRETMTETEKTILWEKLYACTKEILDSAPGCHDFSHTLRVLHNAEMLLESETPEDPFAVRVASLLHDVARPEELKSKGKLCHASIGAGKAEKLLRENGCNDETFIHLVSECVRSHRYRGNDIPQSLEAKIVYDADKLDSTGAFGIARAFHFAGRESAALHNTMDEALASEEYSRGDSAYREYLVKLRHLPGKMMTATGRETARRRTEFMDDFFRTLNDEAGISE